MLRLTQPTNLRFDKLRGMRLLLLTLRISPSIHAAIASAAEANGKSLNKWIADTLDQVVHAH